MKLGLDTPLVRDLITVRLGPSVAIAIARAYFQTEKNSKAREIAFRLTTDDILLMAHNSRGRCAVSGIKFAAGGAKLPYDRQPWAPSIDRVDRSKGYQFDNCRLVSVAANIAMNTWGEEVLVQLATAILRQHEGSMMERST